ncbi:MAG TPA: Uma2 family endonuclease [Thermoanaerobaculia bacterium]|nr:Uma2 family endonuclease [Thermoanaerobaculia bacterium]
MAEPAWKFPLTPATESDLDDLPEGWKGQIVGGKLYAFPRPAGRHLEAATDLAGLLVPPFRFGQGGPGGWVILAEAEVRFGADLLIPDLAGWRRERYALPEKGSAYTVRPDWVCELLSPSTARLDRIKKLPIYAQHGVPHAWIIDPGLQTLEVYRRQGRRWLLVESIEGAATVRVEPFESLALDLGLIWRRGRPDPNDFLAEEALAYGAP